MRGKKDSDAAIEAAFKGGKPGTMNAVLDQGTRFEGKLTFEGSVVVNGNFSGEIFSNDHLTVGEAGVIDGTIEVGSLLLSGAVKGSVTVKNKVEITSKGSFDGDMTVPPNHLKIDPGAYFNGALKMAAPSSGKNTPAKGGETGGGRPSKEGGKG